MEAVGEVAYGEVRKAKPLTPTTVLLDNVLLDTVPLAGEAGRRYEDTIRDGGLTPVGGEACGGEAVGEVAFGEVRKANL